MVHNCFNVTVGGKMNSYTVVSLCMYFFIWIRFHNYENIYQICIIYYFIVKNIIFFAKYFLNFQFHMVILIIRYLNHKMALISGFKNWKYSTRPIVHYIITILKKIMNIFSNNYYYKKQYIFPEWQIFIVKCNTCF